MAKRTCVNPFTDPAWIGTDFAEEIEARALHVEARMTPRPTPYDSPRAELSSDFNIPQTHETDLTDRASRAMKLAFMPIAGVFVVFFFGSMIPQLFPLFAVVSAAATVMGVIGCYVAFAAARDLLRYESSERPHGLGAALAAIPISIIASAMGAMTTMVALLAHSRGRQLRKLGKLQLAPLAKDRSWLTVQETRSETQPDVADAWRKNGLTEHASVAAFARLSMELVALGAPPRLIKSAHEDALDEMQHTTWCFDLAKSFDHKDIGPGAFPAARSRFFPLGSRSLRLARLAVESLVDGAINEGMSARVVAELSREVEDREVKSVLSRIARDEGRHAQHGFDVVRWCVEEGGYPVRIALRSAIARLPEELQGEKLAADAADGRFEAYGIPSRSREARAFVAMSKKLRARTLRLLQPSSKN